MSEFCPLYDMARNMEFNILSLLCRKKEVEEDRKKPKIARDISNAKLQNAKARPSPR